MFHVRSGHTESLWVGRKNEHCQEVVWLTRLVIDILGEWYIVEDQMRNIGITEGVLPSNYMIFRRHIVLLKEQDPKITDAIQRLFECSLWNTHKTYRNKLSVCMFSIEIWAIVDDWKYKIVEMWTLNASV